MPFKGVLKQQMAYTIEVASASAEKTAVTVLKVNRRDKIASADPSTIAAAATTQIQDNVGGNIDRIVIMVAPPEGGQATVRVVQGADQFIQICMGDTQLVFDAVP